jgi:asparagine N-glycosylation enzyme membrane subunit Stt3
MKIHRLHLPALALFAALCVRSLTLPEVITRDAQGRLEIELQRADSSYHARRALYTAENFPSVLLRDSYLAYPDGAVVPMPPLYDFSLGAAARLLGGGQRSLEWVAALVSPILGSLALFPAAWLAALLGSGRSATLAAWLYALLPIAVQWQRLGDADHHAAVSLLGACYLALAARFAHAAAAPARIPALALALTAARATLAATWSGSLLHLGVIEAGLAVALLAAPEARRFAANAAGLALTAALLAIVVHACPPPANVPFTATTLSWLHVTALGAASAVMVFLAAMESARPARGPAARWLGALLVACGIGALALLAVPGLWEGILPGANFIARDDTWASRNPEQLPLLGFVRVPGIERPLLGIGHESYGGFLYLIPFVPVVLFCAARDPARRGPALCVGSFALALAPLAVLQLRFGNEFAVTAAVGFALVLDHLGHRLAGRVGAARARAVVPVLAGLLWLPAASGYLGDSSLRLLSWLQVPGVQARAVFQDIAGFPLLRFARRIRELTPETSGYFDANAKPEYSVLCFPGHGSAIVYQARRPVASNSFGPYLDFEKYTLARRFFEQMKTEDEALDATRRLGSRYVMSFDYGLMPRDIFAHRLHRFDGSERGGDAAVQHFRLLAETEPGERPLWHDFPNGDPGYRVIPYKLFEVVKGAALETRAAPGERVRARIELRTSAGRDFVYRQSARADERGLARLVLPYPTRSDRDDARIVRADGAYRIEAGGAGAELEVSEAAVRDGALLTLSLTAAADGAR